MHSKFSGDHQGSMGSLFGAIMSGAASARLVAENMRVGTFNNAKDDVETSSLTTSRATSLSGNEVNGAFASCGDKIVWEIWEPEPRE